MNQLDILAQHRDALLLAEAIGWLHDYRKCSDEHLKTKAANLSGQQALSRNELAKKQPRLISANLQLPVLPTPRTVTDLLDDRTWWKDLLGQYLSRCHNTAHFDKQEPIDGKQNYPGTKISSPFGFERDISLIGDLTNKLWELPWCFLKGYTDCMHRMLQREVRGLFSQTVADTRRPINEVDLWSWGLLVGALYKSALAGALLMLMGKPPKACDLRWRLLSIRVGGLDYLLNVARIPDLLARQELLKDCLDKVRELIEITYPLGSEVYRDENGSIYVVPDVSNLLSITDTNGTCLQELIRQAFAQGTVKNRPNLQLGGELTPHIELESKSWWGQDPGWPTSSNDELPDIISLINQKISSPPDAEEIKKCWENREATDVCTVCGLRPQGPSAKAAERNVCDICEARRADRSQKWAISEADRTIWTDEVADANGRLALIVGQFDLTHWLDGSLLQTLLLIAPRQNTSVKPITSKTPSFSRLRRIWETTRAFWREVQDKVFEQLSDDRRRLKIFLNSQPNLGPYHVYDLVVGPTDLSVVWVPPQDDATGYLITADNLGYIARQLGAEADVYTRPAKAADFVKDYLCKQFVTCKQFVAPKRQPILRNPDTSASQGRANLIAGFHITKVEYQQNRYATAIPILAEPRSFMLLAPADKSLEILKLIKTKYEQEMSKVRDRLPLHVGCVYAQRRAPIRAVLDAGRAMLDRRVPSQQWKVKNLAKNANDVAIKLEQDGYCIDWHIPLKMGNGTTKDRWYPYFFLETGGDDSKAYKTCRRAVKVSSKGRRRPAHRPRYRTRRRAVKVSRPIGNGQTVDCWIVHAADLCCNETIHLWPSTFDFEFLDTTARRFEICYDENGRRPRRTRPFFLEDLDRFEQLWKYMKYLTKTQRHQVVRTIESTREIWYGQDHEGKSTTDVVFRQFVADTLAGAEWPEKQSWNSIPQEWREALVQAGQRGELADLAELQMEILKE